MKPKVPIPHVMPFHFLFLIIFWTLYLHTPIKKINDYLFNFTGKDQKWMRPTSLDELRTVIGLLIYGGVFESLHEHKESLYKMDGTWRLVFPAVDMLNKMFARYTVRRATRRWTMAVFSGIFNIAAVNELVIYTNKIRKDQPEKKMKRKYFCSELHMIWWHDLYHNDTNFLHCLGTSKQQ